MLYFWSFHYVEIILDFVETVYTAKIWAGLLQKIRLDFEHQGLSLFFYSPKQQNSLFYFNTMKMNVEKMLTEIICKFFLLYSLKKFFNHVWGAKGWWNSTTLGHRGYKRFLDDDRILRERNSWQLMKRKGKGGPCLKYFQGTPLPHPPSCRKMWAIQTNGRSSKLLWAGNLGWKFCISVSLWYFLSLHFLKRQSTQLNSHSLKS